VDRSTTPDAHAARRRKRDPADSEAHAHRRADDEGDMARLHVRIDDLAGMVGGNTRDINRIDGTLTQLASTMQGLTDNTGRLADVLEAWNNVKGFWWTVKAMSTLTKLIMPVLLLFAAVWLFAKTGQWKWP
jgi:hypothetical protein